MGKLVREMLGNRSYGSGGAILESQNSREVRPIGLHFLSNTLLIDV
jgi:hypothetical protein